jgi:transposase
LEQLPNEPLWASCDVLVLVAELDEYFFSLACQGTAQKTFQGPYTGCGRSETIDYVLNRWEAFVRYTSDGRIPIDNNVIERLLRPVAIGRKNYLHFGSEEGGKTGATHYTLVQSARRNCVDVWPYLTDVLRRIAAIAPDDMAALEALLPNRWVAAHPEHRLEQREEESCEAQAHRRRKRAARRIAVAQ